MSFKFNPNITPYLKIQIESPQGYKLISEGEDGFDLFNKIAKINIKDKKTGEVTNLNPHYIFKDIDFEINNNL